MEDEVAEILPILLPESELLNEQNIEIDRTTLKADLVYNIQYRGKTISLLDKQEVEDHLDYYDSLLDQDPYIQQQKALERILGRTEGVQAFQDAIVEIVKNRFPPLVELAQQRVVQIKQLEDLKYLNVQLSIAADQAAARRLLMSTFTA